MSQTIPLQPVPSQSISFVVAGQNCQAKIYTAGGQMFADVQAGGVSLVSCVILRDAVPIVCRDYAGFVGNLVMIDTQGGDDPQYSGLGSRWQLVYLTADEYAII